MNDEQDAFDRTGRDRPISDVPEPGSSGSLVNRAEQLRAEALRNIKQARADRDDAETKLIEANVDEADAVRAALALGIKRKDLAEQLGVSASWVSNIARQGG